MRTKARVSEQNFWQRNDDTSESASVVVTLATRTAHSCQITSEGFSWNLRGKFRNDDRKVSQSHTYSEEKDAVNFKISFIVTMLILCGEGCKGVKERRSAAAIQRYRDTGLWM